MPAALAPLPPPNPMGPTNEDLVRLGVRMNALLPRDIDQPVHAGIGAAYQVRLESQRAFLRAVRTKVFRLGDGFVKGQDAGGYARLADTVQQAIPPATAAYQADYNDGASLRVQPSIVQFPAYDQLGKRLGLSPPDLPTKAPSVERRQISVRQLQQGLNQAGASVSADGKWGPKTKAALEAYLINAGYAGTPYEVSGSSVTLPTALASSLEQLATSAPKGGGTVAPNVPAAAPEVPPPPVPSPSTPMEPAPVPEPPGASMLNVLAYGLLGIGVSVLAWQAWKDEHAKLAGVDLSGLDGAGWNAKDERMYQHVKRSCRDSGRPLATCKRIGAATVNKHRSRRAAR